LRPIVELQESEAATALLMFLYSFLAMTSYNILKPLTRSQFIKNLGADNLPWVLLAAGVLIGVIMQGYSKGVALLPRKWVIPITQTIMAGVLVAFWFAFQTKAEWVSVAFYFFGLILGVLLISQFWTLANEVYDPRQAKRIFGFVGGGSSLGGIMGSTILTSLVGVLGPVHLLLVSAAISSSAPSSSRALGRERTAARNVVSTGEERASAQQRSTCSGTQSTCRSSRW
jgi:AAA family ATP:ADP antiporter